MTRVLAALGRARPLVALAPRRADDPVRRRAAHRPIRPGERPDRDPRARPAAARPARCSASSCGSCPVCRPRPRRARRRRPAARRTTCYAGALLGLGRQARPGAGRRSRRTPSPGSPGGTVRGTRASQPVSRSRPGPTATRRARLPDAARRRRARPRPRLDHGPLAPAWRVQRLREVPLPAGLGRAGGAPPNWSSSPPTSPTSACSTSSSRPCGGTTCPWCGLEAHR